MKQQSPKHLSQGSSGQWQAKLSDRQKQKVEQVAGAMLDLHLLSYPLITSIGLPSLPEDLDSAALEQAIVISHRSPLDQIQRFANFLNSQRTISAKANLVRDWLLDKIKRLVKS